MAENTSISSGDLPTLFTNAASYVKCILSKLNNEQILEFYGFYKQATEGPCQRRKPGWFETTEKHKWKAWSALNTMDSKTAMEKYIHLLSAIEPDWQDQPLEIPKGWVHHSSMTNDDENIDESEKTIFDWVKEKDLEKVKSYCKNNTIDVNCLDQNGLSLLHWASDRGSIDLVKYLIETLKADVNLKDSNGQTPLHYAVSCEYDDIENYLIKAGADVNIKDDDGQSPYDSEY